MQKLLSELYQQTSIQSTLTWTTWGLMLFSFLYVKLYISTHEFDEKNWKFVFKMLIPLIVTFFVAAYNSFDNHKSSTQAKDPNIENFQLKREQNTIHFISKNENLKTADLNIAAENNDYFYLKYGGKIIEVKKDEMKLDN